MNKRPLTLPIEGDETESYRQFEVKQEQLIQIRQVLLQPLKKVTLTLFFEALMSQPF